MFIAAISVVPMSPAPASAGAATGAVVLLDRAQVEVGQRVSVTLAGWRARSVNLAVCGNVARSGSADCNVTESQDAQVTSGSGPTTTYLFVFAPPTTCPCVVRASSANQDEVAVAPIDVVGVPVGPVVGPALDSPIALTSGVQVADRRFMASVRSALGGPASYRVTIRVRNSSAEVLSNVSLAGSVEGSGHQLSFDVPSPGSVAPGQTWEREVRMTLPAPVLGGATWHVIASGAGEAITTDVKTRHVPVGLLILGMVLAADIATILVRRIARRAESPRRLRDAEAVSQVVVATGRACLDRVSPAPG